MPAAPRITWDCCATESVIDHPSDSNRTGEPPASDPGTGPVEDANEQRVDQSDPLSAASDSPPGSDRSPDDASRGAAGAAPSGANPGASGLVDRLRHVGVLWVLLAMLACIPVGAWWVAWVVDIPQNGVLGGATAFGVADDFAVFHTSGTLILDGDVGLLYDVEAFRDRFADNTSAIVRSNTAFANTPAFALVMAPYALFSWQTAWIIWTVLSLGALVLGLRLLGVPRFVRGAGILLLTFPAFLAVNSGQSTFFWFCILAAVFLSLQRGSNVLAGVLAGLLILKPPLLIGLGLWWLIDRRKHKTLFTAAVSAIAVVIVSAPFVGRAWIEYPFAALRFADMHAGSGAQEVQFSPWGFIDLLWPGHQVAATAFGVAAAILGVVAFVTFFRRHRDEWPLLFAAAIFATLWISPHVLPYEWVLLALPLIVLWQYRPGSKEVWLRAAIVLAFIGLWSLPVTVRMTNGLGWAVQLAVPTLAVVVWFIARELRQSVSDQSPSGVSPITHR